MQIRCNFPNISYLSETQKNNYQFLIESWMSLKFSKIEHGSMELAALEHLKKSP